MVSEGVTAKMASIMPAPNPAEKPTVRTTPNLYGI